jgi:hypothetical protein
VTIAQPTSPLLGMGYGGSMVFYGVSMGIDGLCLIYREFERKFWDRKLQGLQIQKPFVTKSLLFSFYSQVISENSDSMSMRTTESPESAYFKRRLQEYPDL